MMRLTVKYLLKCVMVGLAFIVCFWFLNYPVTTRVGINGVVSQETIPLYLKGLRFLLRDIEMRKLSHDIIKGKQEKTEKLLSIFQWTTEHIHHAVPGLPVIDDHPWSIVVRGYGQGDQVNDIFSLICSYAGMEAYYRLFHIQENTKYALSLVYLDSDWTVFDVWRKTYFVNRDKNFATLDQIKRGDFEIISLEKGLSFSKRAYQSLFAKPLKHNHAAKRTSLQKPWSRFLWTLKSVF